MFFVPNIIPKLRFEKKETCNKQFMKPFITLSSKFLETLTLCNDIDF